MKNPRYAREIERLGLHPDADLTEALLCKLCEVQDRLDHVERVGQRRALGREAIGPCPDTWPRAEPQVIDPDVPCHQKTDVVTAYAGILVEVSNGQLKEVNSADYTRQTVLIDIQKARVFSPDRLSYRPVSNWGAHPHFVVYRDRVSQDQLIGPVRLDISMILAGDIVSIAT